MSLTASNNVQIKLLNSKIYIYMAISDNRPPIKTKYRIKKPPPNYWLYNGYRKTGHVLSFGAFCSVILQWYTFLYISICISGTAYSNCAENIRRQHKTFCCPQPDVRYLCTPSWDNQTAGICAHLPETTTNIQQKLILVTVIVSSFCH
jgi:hypothetical protein